MHIHHVRPIHGRATEQIGKERTMRLIVADALMDKISSETIFIKDGLFFQKMIDDAPTIEPSEQVTSKLKNPCDSLLTEDSEDSKEQKSKLEQTCKDCKFCASCIMSAPDGQWKSCKYFEPSDKSAEPQLDVYAQEYKAYRDAHPYGTDKAPSVSAERSGEWIFNGYADEKKSWFICSECDHSQFHKSNYCPNCGARMEAND